MTWYITLGPDWLKLPSGTEAKVGESGKHGLQSICVCYNRGMTSSGDVTGMAKEVSTSLITGSVCD